MLMFFLPACTIVSRVYVYLVITLSRRAASRDMARKPLGASDDFSARGLAHHPATHDLQHLLDGREVLDLRHLPVADDHIGFAAQDRADKVGDHGLRVLVVAVGVHDDVGTEVQASVYAGLESGGETLVAVVAHDVVNAKFAGDFNGAVCRAIVNDQGFGYRRRGRIGAYRA